MHARTLTQEEHRTEMDYFLAVTGRRLLDIHANGLDLTKRGRQPAS